MYQCKVVGLIPDDVEVDTALSDNIIDLRQVCGLLWELFFSSTNKTDDHDITERC